ncbi:MAG: tetratricopeptide repeat protein [Paramuribaculum sp.]|nr:tetratricopeptide repeat protein [Paramuribaculum sp.]
MKLKLVFSLMFGAALAASAQGGYQDGVDNYNAGRPDVAKVILDNTLNDASTDKAVSYFYLGSIDFDAKEFVAAKANFEKGLEANPQYPMNYIGLGQMALYNGDKSQAEDYFKRAVNIDKKDYSVLAAVARAYWNVDPVKYKKEIDKNISEAFKKTKNSEPAVYVLQGDMYAAEDPGEAAGKYEMAIAQAQERGVVNREAYVKYANTYFRVNPNYAIDKLKEFYDREPNSALAQRELAEKYYDNGQMGSAWKMYEKYVQNPNHFRRDEQRYAGLLYSAGEYDKSLEWANKILSEDPSVYQMYRILLLNRAALKDWEGAVDAADKLFNYPDAQLVVNDYELYGDALSQAKRFDEAVAIYEKAISLNPDKDELLPKLSAVYERAGQEAKAVEVYKQYLDKGNGTANDLFNMARRYMGLARTMPEQSEERIATANDGLKYIDMAIEKVPTNGTLYYFKAQLDLVKNDNLPNADMAQSLEKMISIFDGDPSNLESKKSYYQPAYYLLGIYYIDADKAKAKDYFEKYLTMNPDDEKARQIVESLSAAK